MAGCCGPKCSKTFVILYNILFWISGCAFVGLGVVLLYEKSYNYLYTLLHIHADKLPKEIVDYAAYVSIGIGGLILFVGFFGCCGALQESKCMIGTYIFFLILICFVEAAIGLGTFYCYYTFPESTTLKTHLKAQWNEKYAYRGHEDFTNAFNHAQYSMKCCGIDSDTDYLTFSSSQNQFLGGGNQQFSGNQFSGGGVNLGQGNGRILNTTYPLTCCVLSKAYQEEDPWMSPNPENKDQCQNQQRNNNNNGGYGETRQDKQRYEQGCFKELTKWFWCYVIIIGASAGGLALIQILGVLFSLCLIRNIGDEP